MDAFINKYTIPPDQEVPNNSGGFVGECVSLVARYAQEVQGIPNADGVLYCTKTGGARDLYEQYDGLLPKYYDRIPAGTPQIGDLVVWGANRGFYGHVAIYIGNGQVFQQLGTPVFQPAAVAPIGDTSPLGYLRLKGGSMPSTEEVLASALNAERNTNTILQSALNDARKTSDVYASALNAERQKTADLTAQLAKDGTVLAPGNYIVKG